MGVAIVDANPKVKAWQKEVKAVAARELKAAGGKMIDEGPVELDLVFRLPRPKTVSRELPTVKPDALKLARAVEDALTGVLYRDDAQIIEGHQSKLYHATPGVLITVWRME